MRTLAFLLALAGCASRPELPPNEQARRAYYRGKWTIECRDLRAPAEETPFLQFEMQEEDRISGIRFSRGAGPRYDYFSVPRDAYGPFKGEEVREHSSTYLGANDYKVTDELHVFLPYLRTGFESAQLGRDRDSERQNGAVEVAVKGQSYATIVHLRCRRR